MLIAAMVAAPKAATNVAATDAVAVGKAPVAAAAAAAKAANTNVAEVAAGAGAVIGAVADIGELTCHSVKDISTPHLAYTIEMRKVPFESTCVAGTPRESPSL